MKVFGYADRPFHSHRKQDFKIYSALDQVAQVFLKKVWYCVQLSV